jgi:zinc transporter ZupT
MNVERRMMDENSINEPDTRTVAIAFALVFGAGMATAIGASVVLFLPQRRSFPTTTTTTTTTTTPSPATSTSVSSSTSPPTTTAAAAAAAAVPQPSSSAWTLHNTILNRYVLASSLGMSAGVMIYVSLIEIFQKSRIAFIDAGYAENMAYVYATSCFFAGVTIMMVRDIYTYVYIYTYLYDTICMSENDVLLPALNFFHFLTRNRCRFLIVG